ncbi:hypothetical protein [Rhizobium brockwellii]|uniref:hypothetical protein n=1 Tax=Rhizobium brockwellii TaxID=3019932 RepID=UPI00293DE553|nr:hypothetical protein [Rhizobium brockwellii]MDV4159321.1 hypothetical protein [Rhizobium brockwellii]
MYDGSLLGPDGKPDINRIASAFPEHGSGEIDHSTSHGQSFTFAIYPNGIGYDAVIVSQPGYGSRSSGLHDTHRLPGPNGYAKICFAKQPQDLQTTVALAIWWAECTSRYIRTGGSWK